MEFYTSVNKLGNDILYRGYKDGKRQSFKENFKPTLHIQKNDNNDSDSKTLEGWSVSDLNFDSINEATAFCKENREIVNRNVYGMQNYVAQYIRDKFPNKIPFDMSKINVGFLDIEVQSDEGFPDPEKANRELTSIALYCTVDKVWRLWGVKDYDPKKSYIYESRPDAKVVYTKCEDEMELIRSFVTKWSEPDYCPDIVTGFYIRSFDIPYLVNRITNVCGEEYARKLSPWKNMSQRQMSFMGRAKGSTYELTGIQTLDYIDLFQKFGHAYGTNQESYKLDHIAHVILGERKLSYEEYGNLANLYKENPQLYIDYNLKDIDLIVRMEDKAKLIELACTISYKGGVNFHDSLGTTNIWDNIIYRHLSNKNIVIPPRKHVSGDTSYEGAYVKPPIVGMHDWIVSFDLKSMYPNLIIQYNISPETMVEDKNYPSDVDFWLNKESKVPSENAISAHGIAYTHEFQGFLPNIIEEYYNERVLVKDKMIECEKRYEVSKDQADKTEAELYKNQQNAIKILLNSLYGALGNKHFRYFELKNALSITLSAQHAILHAENTLNAEMNKIMKTEGVSYVIYIDTDSVFLNFKPLIDSFKPKDPVKFLDNICEKHFKDVINTSYERLAYKQNAFKNRMWMSREVIANKALWVEKKRYILNVLNSEGVQYEEPKLKIKGIEAIKSSTPEVCRDKFKEIFKVLMLGEEETTQKFIKDFREEFKTLPAHRVAFPRGVTEVDKYICKTNVFVKGTPINSKASIIYNNAIKDNNLDKKYEKIKAGSKIKYVHLKMPNPLHQPVIAFPEFLPKELDIEGYIDYNTQFEKSFLNPLNMILDAIGWSDKPKISMDQFIT